MSPSFDFRHCIEGCLMDARVTEEELENRHRFKEEIPKSSHPFRSLDLTSVCNSNLLQASYMFYSSTCWVSSL